MGVIKGNTRSLDYSSYVATEWYGSLGSPYYIALFKVPVYHPPSMTACSPLRKAWGSARHLFAGLLLRNSDEGETPNVVEFRSIFPARVGPLLGRETNGHLLMPGGVAAMWHVLNTAQAVCAELFLWRVLAESGMSICSRNGPGYRRRRLPNQFHAHGPRHPATQLQSSLHGPGMSADADTLDTSEKDGPSCMLRACPEPRLILPLASKLSSSNGGRK